MYIFINSVWGKIFLYLDSARPFLHSLDTPEPLWTWDRRIRWWHLSTIPGTTPHCLVNTEENVYMFGCETHPSAWPVHFNVRCWYNIYDKTIMLEEFLLWSVSGGRASASGHSYLSLFTQWSRTTDGPHTRLLPSALHVLQWYIHIHI